MLKVLKTTTAIIAVTIGLSACASYEPGSPESIAAMNAELLEAREDQMKDLISDVPDWYLDMPRSDYAVYSVGRAVSADMQFSVDMARMTATAELAGRLGTEVDGMLKNFTTQMGNSNDPVMIQERETVTKNVINSVTLMGHNATEVDVQVENGQYVAYVLLEYPTGKANQLLVNELRKTQELYGQLRANKAFQELENEVESAESE